MRVRPALLLAILFALVSVLSVPPVAFAQDNTDASEQEGVESEADETTEGTDTDPATSEGGDGGAAEEDEGGAGEPEAETGAGEGETGAATEEEGPPWTYQMARITLVLLLLLFLAMGLLYWRLLASRQRAGA